MLGPLPAFNFYISLVKDTSELRQLAGVALDFLIGGFSECSGLESEIKVEELLAGGQNDRVFRFPGRAAFPNIVLSQGVGFGETLYLWHEEFLKGEGKRRNGLIFLANETRIPIKCWSFERGIPVKWSGPALNAGTSATAIEKLEIAHEKLTLEFAPGKVLSGIGAELGI
jgi:phage tail-like protein